MGCLHLGFSKSSYFLLLEKMSPVNRVCSGNVKIFRVTVLNKWLRKLTPAQVKFLHIRSNVLWPIEPPSTNRCMQYTISFAALFLVLTAIFISEVDLASLKSVWSSTQPQDSAPSSSNRGPARRKSLNVRLTSWMLFIILVSSDYKTHLTNRDGLFSLWNSKCHWTMEYGSLPVWLEISRYNKQAQSVTLDILKKVIKKYSRGIRK